MEERGEGEKKPSEGGGGEPKVKRKMKNAYQLEVLEKTYQVETYPSEALRAELSAQLGLSDRQLQMWFCHRRLKDRKGPSSGKRQRKGGGGGGSGGDGSPATATPLMPPPPVASASGAMGRDETGVAELGVDHASGSGSGSSPYGHVDPRRGLVPRIGDAVPRMGTGRYYEPPPQPMAELRAIAFVEAQLGEPLREDGPALGMEFDPLPPGAFGAPIASSAAPPKPLGRAYESSYYERHDGKSIKGPGPPSRAVHEYQFLPQQPTVRSESYERGSQSHYYSSPFEGAGSRTPPLPSGRLHMHGGEEVPIGYGVPSQIPSLGLMSQQSKQGHLLPSSSGEYDGMTRKSPYMGMESSFSAHPITGLDNPPLSTERRAIQEEEVVRVERKRKSEEARVSKEVEAHEKRMRRELEKQDMLRRKREVQMRKDMERQDRERRKEEERLLREKQREEERYQREQRREMERREKFLLKESLRAEKMRQKEELRREKEAARQKAANDRAAARRIAKESMELIEDARLELMEIAASRKGLPSILSLDGETLQNLDSFRDMLAEFPPKSVHLKRPFAIQPWTCSDENVGNLLMVWRFTITFADSFGLWPFTLDEFVQAFHDYESRLLGEIHVSVLRTIMKDIEDVARTPSTGLGVNQNNAANLCGGHPQIVEGAYTWGFDIRSWQRHLSLLTWPEILRQFALAAGFGPKLKKRNIEPTYLREDNEGNDGSDVIARLRTGAAAEKAVAIMRRRGYSNPRRSRHRLTPGTVKFAAFHVLSLEGERGLNILEVADRIQKSGLRDLTTSKTPEASVAAALSRDTKLFERTAPSTYCVRSPYRKDPSDAEAILSTARERIRVFKSGFADGVEADVDGLEADDVEKEEDSESDTAEDPELDDLGSELTPNKDLDLAYEPNICKPQILTDNGIENMHAGAVGNTQNGLASMGSLPSGHLEDIEDLNNANTSVEGSFDFEAIHNEQTSADEDTDIDESSPGESWVQGLMEGEYSNLSVEERLNALVALISVATEGNSMRMVLEERLEAATALKKQMWAEAQLDKRRMKDEYLMRAHYTPFAVNKTEQNITNTVADTRQSTLLVSDMKNHESVVNLAAPLHDRRADADPYTEKNLMTPDFSAGPENLTLQHAVHAAERSRAQLKAYVGHKAEELYPYRSLPLGQDRRRNRYWQFMASASRNDPGSGRIFVELHNGCWRLIDSEEGFDALIASLDVRGVRESHLHAMLKKIEPLFKESIRKNRQDKASVKAEAFEVVFPLESSGGTDSPRSNLYASSSESPEPSSSFKIENGRSNLELKNSLRRYKDFEEWMCKECSSSMLHATKYGEKRRPELLRICEQCHNLYLVEDNCCPTCHKTYGPFDTGASFSEHLVRCEENFKYNCAQSLHGLDCLPPPRIRLVKALLATMEVCIPSEALQPIWSDDYRKSWGMKLHMSSSGEELLQVLTLLEGAIKRDFLALYFQKTSELSGSGGMSGYANDTGSVNVLPWIPQTTAAVALRLMELDAAVSYIPDQKPEPGNDTDGEFIKLPSSYAAMRTFQDDELAGTHDHHHPDPWTDTGNGYLALGRARGGQGRGRGRSRGGGRPERRVAGSRSERGGRRTRVASTSERLSPVLGGWKGRSSRGRGGHSRGRRSVRSRQRPVKKIRAVSGARTVPEPVVSVKSPPESPVRDEWIGEEHEQLPVEADDANDSSSERSSYEEEDNGQVSGDEYDVAMDEYAGVYNGKRGEFLEGSEENAEGDEEDDDNDEDGDEDDELEVEGAEYEQGDGNGGEFMMNEESDDEEDEDDDGTGSSSSSTDYSD